MAIKAGHVWACISQPQSPEALLKRLLIYNTKHTSCSAKQRKITLCACVCVCVLMWSIQKQLLALRWIKHWGCISPLASRGLPLSRLKLNWCRRVPLSASSQLLQTPAQSLESPTSAPTRRPWPSKSIRAPHNESHFTLANDTSIHLHHLHGRHLEVRPSEVSSPGHPPRGHT